MQINTVTNQYINNYHNRVENSNQINTRAQETARENHEYWESMKAIYYMLMMQNFMKNQMFYMLDSLKLNRSIDIRA